MNPILRKLFDENYTLPAASEAEMQYAVQGAKLLTSLSTVQQVQLEELMESHDTYLEEAVEDSFVQGFAVGFELSSALHQHCQVLRETASSVDDSQRLGA